MKILVVNDDGVNAPGIKILAEHLSSIAEVVTVAPSIERSTTGHTVTLDHPLRIQELKKNIYSCSGYPADCTLMGLGHLLKEDPPDLVVSGINRGANLAQDVYYSGTVAAAREACFHGFPAIAVSLVCDAHRAIDQVDHYNVAAQYVVQLVERGAHKKIEPKSILNINVPNLPTNEIKGARVTRSGFRRYSDDIGQRNDYRNRQYYWIAGIYQGFESIENSDCLAIEERFISVTPLNFFEFSPDNIDKWSHELDL